MSFELGKGAGNDPGGINAQKSVARSAWKLSSQWFRWKNVQTKNVIDNEKNQLEKVKAILEQARAELSSATEIQKAKIDAHAQWGKTLADMHKTSVQGATNLLKKES